jgi:intein/homing endonuclease
VSYSTTLTLRHARTIAFICMISPRCVLRSWISENICVYADAIHYTYSEKKRIDSAPVIEYLKLYEFNKSLWRILYTPALFVKTVRPVIRAAARRDTHRVYNKYDLRIPFKVFKYESVKDRCVSVPIFSKITPEMVYDFTTHSNNHSFVASSFVTHNCAVRPSRRC